MVTRAKGLIPHAPPMLLVDELRLADEDRDRAEVAATVAGEGLFTDPATGALDPAAMVELAAQAYALARAAQASRRGTAPGMGFLVGVGPFTVHAPAAAGDELLVHVSGSRVLDEFALVTASITRGGEVLAEGRLKVFSPAGEDAP